MKYSVLAIAIVILFTGCAKEFIPIREDMELTRLKQPQPLVPYRVTVAPVKALYDREYYNENQSSEEHGWIPEFDFEVQQQDIASLFEEFNLFQEAKPYNGPVGDSANQVLEDAYNGLSDFVVQLELVNYKVSFAGFSKSYIPNMIGWFLLTPPSWWIPDELFRSEAFFNMKLIDVYTQRVLFNRQYKGLEERALNDFERGWKLFGIFRTPGFLQVQNWEKIHRQLTPFAIKDGKVKLMSSIVEGEFSRFVQSSEFRDQVAKQVALCIGISRHNDRRIPAIKFAARDGELMQSVLSDTDRGAGINPGFCRLLKDQQASRADIMAALSDLGADRCRPLDSFMFYFAGYGYVGTDPATGSSEGFIIPADCDFDRVAESAISMSALKTAIDKINARNVLIVLDCAFTATTAGRSLPGTRRGRSADFLIPLTKNPKVRLVLGASPGQNAYEFDSLRNGLFTYYICNGVLEKAGDVNLDGRIMLQEVYQYARNNLFEISAYKGSRQEPTTMGEGDFSFAMHKPQTRFFDEAVGEEDILIPETATEETIEPVEDVPEDDEFLFGE